MKQIIGNILYSLGTGDEISTFSLNMNLIGAIIPGAITLGLITEEEVSRQLESIDKS